MKKEYKFVDLFCGIGGFHIAAQMAGKEAGASLSGVWACDVNRECRTVYEANFGLTPAGDIQPIPADSVPDHDLLFAGFPRQPFSIIGDRLGFSDIRGTLFFDIARIIEAKRPRAFILENVKMLAGHEGGRTLAKILSTLENLNYNVHYKILNALDFGLPQKRERIILVGFADEVNFNWPSQKMKMLPLADILELEVPKKYFASARIRASRHESHSLENQPTIWHENKSGHVSKYPYSCALRAGASYNYLLVDGERRLTEREMFRLQGFPDSFKIISNPSQSRRQAGNSVPVPMIKEVIKQVLNALEPSNLEVIYSQREVNYQLSLPLTGGLEYIRG